jgi:hypothetical protein
MLNTAKWTTRNRSAMSWLVLILTLAAVVPALSDDQKSADKQISKIKAMAWDPAAREAVNKSIADTFKKDRNQLIQTRRIINADYGSMFLLEEISASGVSLDDLAGEVKGGKTAAQIANERRVDWKTIQADAKKMNALIEKNLLDQLGSSNEVEPSGTAVQYDPAADSLEVDSEVPPDQVAAAGDTYSRLKNLVAGKTKSQGIDDAGELNARHDQVRSH